MRTVEIPEALFQLVEVRANQLGILPESVVIAALTDHLSPPANPAAERTWMKCFGALSHLKEDNARLNQIIEEEFGQIEPEMWR